LFDNFTICMHKFRKKTVLMQRKLKITSLNRKIVI